MLQCTYRYGNIKTLHFPHQKHYGNNKALALLYNFSSARFFFSRNISPIMICIILTTQAFSEMNFFANVLVLLLHDMKLTLVTPHASFDIQNTKILHYEDFTCIL